MKIQGNVKEVTPIIENNGFKKRMLIIGWTDNGRDKLLGIEFGGGSIDRVDGINEGDVVEVDCESTSRQWQDKWFTSCRGWAVRVVEAAHKTARPTAEAKEDNGSDIPF